MTADPVSASPVNAVTSPDFAAITADLMNRIDQLCQLTEVPGSVQRTFLSTTAARMHAALNAWATELGLDAWVDAAGNWHAVLPGPNPDAPTFIIGSHLDTVPDGGKYDGLLGVVLGLALAGQLKRSPAARPYRLEVLGFSEEEGVRFGVPFIGSLSALGQAGPLLDVRDSQGRSVRQAMRDFGLDDMHIGDATLSGPHLGFLEVHIEQGPVLEAAGLPLAVVPGIAGQTRILAGFTGKAGHAGTTPMALRHDALTAAARVVLEAERLAMEQPPLLATVGKLEVQPGAGNVIPGQVTFTLDVRHPDDDARESAIAALLAFCRELALERGLGWHWKIKQSHPAVACDPGLTSLLSAAVAAGQDRVPEVFSGAGHDAVVMAGVCPATMLFVRCRGGLSHHPDEYASPGDFAAALEAAVRFVLFLAAPLHV